MSKEGLIRASNIRSRKTDYDISAAQVSAAKARLSANRSAGRSGH